MISASDCKLIQDRLKEVNYDGYISCKDQAFQSNYDQELGEEYSQVIYTSALDGKEYYCDWEGNVEDTVDELIYMLQNK